MSPFLTGFINLYKSDLWKKYFLKNIDVMKTKSEKLEVCECQVEKIFLNDFLKSRLDPLRKSET